VQRRRHARLPPDSPARGLKRPPNPWPIINDPFTGHPILGTARGSCNYRFQLPNFSNAFTQPIGSDQAWYTLNAIPTTD
jgi:hypothetical protein